MLPQESKIKYLFYAKVLIALAIIAFLISFINFTEITKAINIADVNLLIIVLMLGIVNVTIQFFKWKNLCNKNIGEFKKRNIAISLFTGFSVGLITPMRVGEYAGRFNGIESTNILRITYSALIDKFSLLFVEFALGGILALLFASKFIPLSSWQLLLSILAYAVISALFVLVYYESFLQYSFVKKIFSKTSFLKSIFEKYSSLSVADTRLKNNILALSAAQYLCFILQYALLICAFTGMNEILNYIYASGFLFLVKNIISFLTPGELGTREGLSVFTMSLIAVPGAAAFNAAMMLFIINILLPAVIGLFFMIQKK